MSSAAQPVPQLQGGSAESGDHAKFGVVTVSDRASQQVYQDVSGPAILQFFQEAIKSKYASLHSADLTAYLWSLVP